MQGPVRSRLRHHAHAMDRYLATLWRELSPPPGLALLAVGGYGRASLYPYSDLDILLLGDSSSAAAEEFSRRFLTTLWDQGYRVGAALRSVEESWQAAQADLSIATTLLERRLVQGSRATWKELQTRLHAAQPWEATAFFAAKVAEQSVRHQRFADTAYHLEPQIKESPGGLRDIHQLLWYAGRFLGRASLAALAEAGLMQRQELHQLQRAESFLAEVRVALHLLTQRAEDRLRLDYQEDIANSLGIIPTRTRSAAERLMQQLYRAFAQVQRIVAIVETTMGQYLAMGGRVASRPVFPSAPLALLQELGRLASAGQEPSPLLLRQAHDHRALWSGKLLAEPAFRHGLLRILADPQTGSLLLRWLHQASLLGRLLPAFERISGLIQHDLFHAYTVDQHTLFLLQELAKLHATASTDATVQKAWMQIHRPALLLLAGIFHDIGKGRGGDHSRIGAREWQLFARSLQVAADDRSLVSWLVEEHLQMSSTSQRRDLDDPLVIAHFAGQVGDQARLAHLFLLTIADMRATNPDLWNGWKASLLYKLYNKTDAYLAAGSPKDTPQELAKTKKTQVLTAFSPADQERLQRIWQGLSASYFLRYQNEELLWHGQEILHYGNVYHVAIRAHPLEGEQIFIFGADRPGLFQDIAGVLDRHSLNILDARIDTSTEGYALDTFLVLDHSRGFGHSSKAYAQLAEELLEVLNGGIAAHPRFGPRHHDTRHRFFSTIPTHVTLDNTALHLDTLLQISAADRMGLLYQVATAIREQGFSLVGAKVSTFGERVEDTFFLRNGHGEKLSRRQLQHFRRQLLTRLQENKISRGGKTA